MTILPRRITPTLLLFAAAARAAAGQQVTAMTMPLKDDNAQHWHFFGDRLVGLDVDRGVLKLSARINTYSLTQGSLLWRQEFEMGFKMNEVDGEVWFQGDRDRILVGTGPVSAVTLDGKSWTLSCDAVGPVNLGEAVQLDPDRLLIFGNDSCKNGFKADPQVMLVDGTTGKVMWTYKSKGQYFDAPMGYWARVAYYQGRAKKAKVLQFRIWPLVQTSNGYESGLADKNRGATAKADRVLIIGKYMEVLNVADGSLIYKSPKETDRLEGFYGPYVFLRDGDKLSAVRAGSGETVWTLDLDKAGTTLYNGDDIAVQGDASPLGSNDLLVSEHRFVNRVDINTGQKKWTIERENHSWYGTLGALMVCDEDGVAAYDWQTGAKRWELKQGKFLHAIGDQSLPVMVLVDRGKKDEGEWVGPYKFFGVEQATGRLVWSRGDIDGKKITSVTFASASDVVLTSETGQSVIVDVMTGSPSKMVAVAAPAGAPVAGGGRCYPAYAPAVKALECRDAAGAVVWDRKGEVSERQSPIVRGGIVVWAAKNGEVEVIKRADGSSLWKTKVDGNPRAWMNGEGTYVAVPGGGKVAVVHIAS